MSGEVGLPEALERAASALAADADAIRPANGDPFQLLSLLDREAAARVLAWLLEHESPAGVELAEAWAEESDSGLPIVVGLDEARLPKPARKALRRARHQLRTRGVELPDAPRKARTASLPSLDDHVDEALVTPLDPSGARLLYLATDHPSGGVRMFMVACDEERGIVEFELYSSGRRDARNFLRDFRKRERFAGVEAPPAAVRALLARAVAEHPSERPLPRGFSEWRSRITEDAEGEATPGEIVRGALAPAEPVPQALERVIALMREGELGPWVARPGALDAALPKLRDIQSGVVIVSGAAKQERVQAVLDETLEALYASPSDERTARRFEESAYVLWKSDREDDARACLTAADTFRKEPAMSNPVARAALERLLAPVLAQLEEDAEEKSEADDEEASSVLVKP
jgi:hypothetical protein